MCLKLSYLITNLLISAVICKRDPFDKDSLIIKVNDEVIANGKHVTHENSNTYKKLMHYEFDENEKLKLTCKYKNIPGPYHKVIWTLSGKPGVAKCFDNYHTDGYMTVDWTPKHDSNVTCQVIAGNQNLMEGCATKNYILIGIIHFRRRIRNTNTTQTIQKQISYAQNTEPISIKGLPPMNIITQSEHYYRYKYRDNDTLNLTCLFKSIAEANFKMTWSMDGVTLKQTDSDENGLCELEVDITLHKNNSESKIICDVTEVTHLSSSSSYKVRNNITVELCKANVEVNNVTTEIISQSIEIVSHQDPSRPEKKNYYNLIIIIAVVVIIIIMAIVIIFYVYCKKKTVKTDKVILQYNSAETISRTLKPETYATPADHLNHNASDLNDYYTSPYNGVIYTTPIPKKLRVVNKMEYENLRTKNQKPSKNVPVDKIGYENTKDASLTYANLVNKDIDLYSNTMPSRNIESDMYSYIVVDK